ncbi:hypothetical protein JG688_00015506 [Phytophthora aleatoria]|uniref:START-like domain n=1 Tax=Phytophthora aleatoria TaxID=2496075 RepID=A0A8J5MDD5_9STRA|nr:hypothetical protein JG688_00015506 [Phytophthora aleatoria]
MKGRFTANPFEDLALTPRDANNLLDIVNTIVHTGFERYENFWTVEKAKVNTDKWKLIKSKENSHVFLEQQPQRQYDDPIADLPSLLCVGASAGTLDDVMLGVVNPTLESMRVKASYVNDLSAAAVLSNVVMPSNEDPFRSVVVKWKELDIPFQSAGLVKNRDYVYVEATGVTETFDGERVGFHVLHSVNFPQTSSLPNRVRANMSICGFFRQVRPNLVSVYVTGILNHVGNERVRRLVVSNMANAFLSTLKYAHCGQMKKLAWALDSAYSKLKVVGTPDPERICVSCSKTVSRRVGDFGKGGDTCKLCCGLVCGTCKLQRKISFVGPDLRLAQRKVNFCAVCLNGTLKKDAGQAARKQIRSDIRASMASRKMSVYSDLSTVTSDEPPTEEPPRFSNQEELIQSQLIAMVNGRFTINPFKELALTPGDISNLHEISSAILDSNLSRYEEFLNVDKSRVDPNHWKLVKSRDNTKVYQEKTAGTRRNAVPLPQASGSSSDLPSMLCVGVTVGDMEDMMFGVVNPTLEIMRIKASYVEDLSGAAVIANVVEPTLENPFNSMVVKWMEMDIPLQSVGLVRNRDYIYVEVTGFVHLENGEKVGYHILLSVNFPETHDLPNRVRANLSICGFFRQVRPNASEIFVTGLMDPGGDMIRMLVVPTMANAFLATLKYAHCGQMKKLQYMLEKRYAEAKELGTPNREHVCVTCGVQITNRRLGDFAQRKVTFCAVCLNDAVRAPAAEAARAQIVTSVGGMMKKHSHYHGSEASTISEYASSCG